MDIGASSAGAVTPSPSGLAAPDVPARGRLWLRGIAAALGLFGVLAGTAAGAPLPADTLRGPYLVADAQTGAVYEHYDAQRPWYPASTTKLMTLYVTFRAILADELTLHSPLVYSANAAAQPASKMGFWAGTTLSLADALRMLMVKSANDVAVAVAENVAGSVPDFAARMNAEAARLGMSRSHFVNPHGLPDGRQVTTARDMALLARALLVEFPQYRDFYDIHAIQIGDKILENYNPLLERYPGANGMKTGFICASGYNLVASAQRGGREVIAVVFGEYGGLDRALHAAALLDRGLQAAAEPPQQPRPTLADVSSGLAFSSALDMRPFICAPRQEAAASEANMEAATADAAELLDPLLKIGPPLQMRPPIRVSVQAPVKNAKPGQPGFVVRLPKQRPTFADEERTALDAFAPIAGAMPAPAEAIGTAVGGPLPLSGITPN